MDLVNELSSDVVLAVLVEGRLRQKIKALDAKSFIELIEAELSRMSREGRDQSNPTAITADLSH